MGDRALQSMNDIDTYVRDIFEFELDNFHESLYSYQARENEPHLLQSTSNQDTSFRSVRTE